MKLRVVILSLALLLPLTGLSAKRMIITADSVLDGVSNSSLLLPMNSFGPVGAYGPLGTLGPLGSNAWNTAAVMRGLGSWSQLSRFFTLHGGPLSDAGPLGSRGPLTEHAYEDILPRIGPYTQQLQLGGFLSVLGPLGPMGALGPLGPLGSMGGHGFEVDDDGNYLDGGRVQREVVVPFGADSRTFELFESYSEAAAKQKRNNDTSFMVYGEIAGAGIDRYSFRSQESQFLTILVVPEKQLDVFGVGLYKAGGNLLAESHATLLINWLQVQVRAGEEFAVVVNLIGSAHFLSKTYRLIVIGSSPYFNSTSITGSHQLQ